MEKEYIEQLAEKYIQEEVKRILPKYLEKSLAKYIPEFLKRNREKFDEVIKGVIITSIENDLQKDIARITSDMLYNKLIEQPVVDNDYDDFY